MGFALLVQAAVAEGAAFPRQHRFPLQHPRFHLFKNNSTVPTESPTTATSARATTTTISRWRSWRQPQTQPSAEALPPLLQRPQKPPATNKQQPHPLISTTTTPDTGSISSDGEDEGGGVVPGTCTAADVLRLMDGLRLPIEADLYGSLVRECTHSRDAFQGAQVHAHIQRSRPALLRRPPGLPLANRLLLMYAACGRLDSARQLFDRMPFRDAMSWTAMLAALAHHGSHQEALQLFAEMCETAVEPGGALALVTTLRSCVEARELGLARQVHGLALKVPDVWYGGGGISSALLRCYSMLGCHESAKRVFERMGMRSRDAAAWTCMITGCCRERRFEEALYVFREMGRAEPSWRRRRRSCCHLFSSILVACARIGDGGWGGRQVHASALKLGADADRFVGRSLVDMYAKHGLLKDARGAFESIDGLKDSAACWNAMLAGYARGGCCSEAIRLLYEMRTAGVRPQHSLVDEVRIACSERLIFCESSRKEI